MLRGFSASYAGHIVDDRLGLQGTPANDRWYPNDKLAEAFDWAVDFAQLLDTLPNKSAFIRKAILAQLGETCPLCNGSGVVPHGLHDHYATLLPQQKH